MTLQAHENSRRDEIRRHVADAHVTAPGLNDQRLATALRRTLVESPQTSGDLFVVDRQRDLFSSTSDVELITVRSREGETRRFLWKRDDGRERIREHGGVAYEIAVYAILRGSLAESPCSVPGSYLGHYEPAVDECWLVLEYFNDALRLDRTDVDSDLAAAGRWFGLFHRIQAERTSSATSVLRRHDPRRYGAWVSRTLTHAQPMIKELDWLPTLCRRADAAWELLAASAPTMIHGEAYPKNILISGDDVVVVDWETAAVGPGEIDIAALTEGWPPARVGQVLQSYRGARWSQGEVPSSFHTRVLAARLFLQFRWLGERRAWTLHPRSRARFTRLHRRGSQLGLL